MLMLMWRWGRAVLADLGEQMLGMNEQFNLPSTLADFRASTPVFADNSSRIEQIKADIEKLGAVNLAAAAELAELEERVSPLDEQVADITDSMKKLQDAIRAIDDKTKQLFLGMLKAVNDEMNALFAKVFGGGQASLTLIDDESLPKADKWRAGLVLMAQPKGKKKLTPCRAVRGRENTDRPKSDFCDFQTAPCSVLCA